MDGQYMLTLLMGIIQGLLCFHFAKLKGRDPISWFFIGLFFGILGLLLLFLLPNSEPSSTSLQKVDSSDADKRSFVEEKTPLSLGEEEMENGWFYLNATWQPQGPIERRQLVLLWKRGEISPKSYLWHPSWEGWRPLAELTDFLERKA